VASSALAARRRQRHAVQQEGKPPVAERGGSYLPFAGELTQVSKQIRLKMNLKFHGRRAL
jgi:hypothetical protein